MCILLNTFLNSKKKKNHASYYYQQKRYMEHDSGSYTVNSTKALMQLIEETNLILEKCRMKCDPVASRVNKYNPFVFLRRKVHTTKFLKNSGRSSKVMQEYKHPMCTAKRARLNQFVKQATSDKKKFILIAKIKDIPDRNRSKNPAHAIPDLIKLMLLPKNKNFPEKDINITSTHFVKGHREKLIPTPKIPRSYVHPNIHPVFRDIREIKAEADKIIAPEVPIVPSSDIAGKSFAERFKELLNNHSPRDTQGNPLYTNAVAKLKADINLLENTSNEELKEIVTNPETGASNKNLPLTQKTNVNALPTQSYTTTHAEYRAPIKVITPTLPPLNPSSMQEIPPSLTNNSTSQGPLIIPNFASDTL